MDYKNCELYKVKRKRDLFVLLHIDENKLNEELYKYRVCIKDKKRLLEKPSEELKKIKEQNLAHNLSLLVLYSITTKNNYFNKLSEIQDEDEKNKFVKEIDTVIAAKEKEVMSV